jgi:hypothetical protein
VYGPYVTVQFSEPVTESTVTNQAIQLLKQGQPLPAAVTYSGPYRQATLMLRTRLQLRTSYTLRVSKQVKDLVGNPMAADYLATFQTSAINVYLPVVLRGG